MRLLLANRKAKKLIGLLKRQVGSSVRPPYLEPLIFSSHSDTKIELEESAAYRVCTRDKFAKDGSIKEKGILSALMHRDFLGAAEAPKSYITPLIVKTVVRAMEQLGIKSSQRNRKVEDYLLNERNLHLETPSVDALAQQIFGTASSDNKTESEVLSALIRL